MADELRYSALHNDDFPYIAESLDWPTTQAHLFEPHNTHVVPLFRLWTAAIVALAGQLEDMPKAFRAAAYCGLIMTMLAVFILVASETGRTNLGLAAMAGTGISTVMQPAVSWYSAGQALIAGMMIVLTLIAARAWSRYGGVWRFLLVGLAALAAPAFWSGGLLAGPTAAAYIIAKNPAKFRAPLVALVLVTALAVLFVVGFSLGQINNKNAIWEPHEQVINTNAIWVHHKELWPRPVQVWLHTFQAISRDSDPRESRVRPAVASPSQATALVVVLVGIWLSSRGGLRGINPLEASGAVLVVGSYLLVYFLRGNFPYSSLRYLVWYNAIPQIGAGLFAAGWWQSLRPAPPHGLTRIEALALLGFVGVLSVFCRPRIADRNLIESAPPLVGSEGQAYPIPRSFVATGLCISRKNSLAGKVQDARETHQG